MTRGSRITKYVQVVTLVLLGAILFFWPFFDALAPTLDFMKIAGIITAVLAAVVLYFDDRISQIIRGPSGVISHGTLGECVDQALKGRKNVGHLRVMATSSEVVEALIASRGTTIGRCDLLLRLYPDGPKSYNARVDFAIDEWNSLVASGHLRELNIARYDSVPTEYQVIFDDDAIIFGGYVYRPNEPAEAHFSAPSLVHNVSPEARDLIQRFSKAFDANHAAWDAASRSGGSQAASAAEALPAP